MTVGKRKLWKRVVALMLALILSVQTGISACAEAVEGNTEMASEVQEEATQEKMQESEPATEATESVKETTEEVRAATEEIVASTEEKTTEEEQSTTTASTEEWNEKVPEEEITEEISKEVTTGEQGKKKTEKADAQDPVVTTYTYEDSKIQVTAELQYADAVPDDAEFRVTPVTFSTQGYDFDTYMEALNENAKKIAKETGKEEIQYTEDNTLLYDIGFFVEPVDEEGNKTGGSKIEYQPTSGSVKITLTFLNHQLSDTIGAEEEDAVTVIHLPLNDSVKDKVDTTKDADNLSVDDIKIEVVDDTVSLNKKKETAEFSLSDFSVAAVTAHHEPVKIEPMTDYSLYHILNNYSTFINGDVTIGHSVGATATAGNYKSNVTISGNGYVHTASSYIKGNANFAGYYPGNKELPLILGNVNQGKSINVDWGTQILYSNDYIDFDAAFRAIQNEIASLPISTFSTENNGKIQLGQNYNIHLSEMIHQYYGEYELVQASDGLSDMDTIVYDDSEGEIYFRIKQDLYDVGAEYNSNGLGLVYVFPNATKIHVSNWYKYLGHIVAPNAEVIFDGDMNYAGSIVAKSLDAKGSECHMWPYNGTNFDEDGGDNNGREASGTLILTGKKTLEGRALEAGQFTFDLYKVETRNGEEVEKFISSATNDSNGKIHFTLNYSYNTKNNTDETGEYTYRIREVNEGKPGYTYADPVDIRVKVEDNGGDTLSIKTNKKVNGEDTEIVFHNTYAAETSVTLGATKELSGREMNAGEFSFVLSGEGVEQTRTNQADGTVTFDPITYNQDDAGKTFEYTIRELEGNKTGITYDTKTYTVQVKVGYDEKGNLAATPSQKAEKIIFQNEYQVNASVSVQAHKTLTGRALLAGDFQFQLKDEDGNVLQSVYNQTSASDEAEKGIVSFDDLLYNQSDIGHTYTYTVSEVKPDKAAAGYTYSEDIYTIQVRVDQAEDDTLTVQKTVTKNGESYDSEVLEFANTYEAKGSTTISGTKELTGKNLSDGEFTFILFDKEENGLQTVTNKGKQFAFDEIEYTQEDIGKHTYYVTEMQEEKEGYLYDDAFYQVTVTVKAPAMNSEHPDQLIVTQKIVKEDDTNTEVDAITFQNTYIAKGNALIQVSKELEGKALEKDEFTFELRDEQGSLIEEKTNDAEGKVIFTPNNYSSTEVGTSTYIYTITEKQPEEIPGGYTYSDAVITAVVTVIHTEDGQISTEVTYYNGDQTTEENRTDAPCFINQYEAQGSITLTGKKILEGKTLQAEQFAFQLYKVEADKTTTPIGDLVRNDEEGNLTFEPLYFTQDDIGTHTYHIVEQELEGIEGYTYAKPVTVEVTVADNGDGTLAVTATPNGTEEDGILFQNSYSAETSITLEAHKTLTGKELEENQFQFTLDQDEDGDNTVHQTKSNEKDGSITFDAIYYNQDDIGKTCNYTLREVTPDNPVRGYTYSDEEYQIQVTIIENQDGTIRAEKTIRTSDGTAYTGIPEFINSYEASGQITLKATKQITGKTLGDDTFDFILADENQNTIETVQNAADGSITFSTLRYDQSQIGTYVYFIKERIVSKEYYKYDESVYKVTVNVNYPESDKNQDKLDLTCSLEKTLDGITIPVDSITFQNIYYKPEQTVVSMGAGLTLSGTKYYSSELEEGQFEFELEEVNEKGEALEDGYQETVSNQADGTFQFSSIVYEEEGTHYYKIKEKNGNQAIEGIYYDGREYTVEANIVSMGAGIFEIITDQYAFNLNFNNGYRPDEAYVQLGGIKQYHKILSDGTETAMQLTGGEFTFHLEEVDEDGTPLSDEMAYTDTASNTETGIFQFQQIIYGTAGVHHYKITEENVGTKANGITCDEQESLVTVTVTDNGKGKLEATVSPEAKDVVFRNKYQPNSGSIQFEGTKSYNRDLEGEDFYFVLTETNQDGKALENAYTETVTNDKDGKIAFQEITYYEEGTHYYTVKEVNGGETLNGITYDESTYLITVEVKDNAKGQLIAAAVSTTEQKSGTDAEAIEFSNNYKAAEGSIQLGAAKIYNKPLAGGEFTFTLTETDKNGTAIENGLTETVTNDATGGIQFSEITYTEPGTHYYQMMEANGGEIIQGVTYDKTSYLVTVEAADNGQGQLIVTADQTADEVLFQNSYKAAEGNIQLGAVKSYNKTLKGEEFAFTLTEADEAGNPIENGWTETVTNDSDGNIRFSEITYAEPGIHFYQIREKNGGKTIDGITYDDTVYTVKVEVTDDGEGQLIVSADQTEAELIFNNSYEAAEGSIRFEGTKTYNQNLEGEDFHFILTETDSEGNALEDAYTETVTNDKDGTIAFQEITYAKAGTYYYTVQEVNGGETLNGITYDESSYLITVEVKDNAKGQLIAETISTISQKSGKEAKAIQFSNTYKASNGTIQLGATKTYNRTLSGEDFTFILTETDKDGKVMENSLTETAVNDANGGIQFSEITYTEPGTHYYQITEANGGETIQGVTYDNASYLITVEVKDNAKGQLIATADQTADSILFQNEYQAAEGTIQLGAVKSYNKPLEGGDFEFTLTEADQNGNAMENGLTETVTNDAKGSILFSELTYTEVGTHYYQIQETNGGQNIKGISYDDTVYTVKVEVTDDGEGQLIASADKTVAQLIFQNGYEAAAGSIQFKGTKSYNRDLSGKDFSFILTETDSDGKALENAYTETVRNDSRGTIQFQEITYEAEGIHYYTIKEVNGGATLNGVTYDEASYLITVEVKDNAAGKLVAKAVSIKEQKSGKTADAVTFDNTYNAADGSIQLGAVKNYNNTLNGEEFEFTLTEVDEAGNGIEGGVTETVTNDANGGIQFSQIAYKEAGTYYYQIRETNGGENIEGITYDDTVYTVTVEVTDNGEGRLIAAADQTADAVRFQNTYQAAEGTIRLGAVKSYNKTLEGNDFEFTLTEVDETGHPVAGGTAETVTNDADGGIQFSEISYKEAGTYYYQIRETNGGETIKGITYDDTAYTVAVEVTDNGKGQLVAGADKEAAKLIFQNRYETAEGSIQIKGTKTYNQALAGEDFHFILTETDSDGTALEDAYTETVTNDKDGTIAFQEITYPEEGTYYYTIKEVNGGETLNGITYDETSYLIQVEVKDNGAGKLVAAVVSTTNQKSGKYAKAIQFDNIYKASKGSIQLGAAKNYDKALEGGEFTFTLTEVDQNGQIMENGVNETATNDANGGIQFGEITYLEAGTHYYQISETNGGQTIDGITYDKTAYLVTVEVKDNAKGKLIAVADQTADEILFENTYEAAEGSIRLTGTKTYDRELNGEEFRFILTETDSEGEALENAYTETASNDSEGAIQFQQITYSEAGTHYYTIKEVNGGETLNGITYDEASYLITVEVNDNAKGQLEAEVISITEQTSGNAADAVEFYNTYQASEGSIRLGATKSYNKPLEGNDFAFALTEVDQAGNPLENSSTEITANNENGVIQFSEITYAEAGTYYYQISEVNGGNSINGTRYDASSYIVTVTVKDQDGKLVAQADKTAEEIKFENTYQTTILVKKTDITDGEELEGATIQILDKDGNVVDEWISTKEAHEVAGLQNGETYILKETVAPEGYTITSDTVFTLSEDGTIDADKTTTNRKDGVLLVEDQKEEQQEEEKTEATTEDKTEETTEDKTEDKTYRIEVSKVDIGNGEELDGAHILVIDQDGNVIDEWDSKAGETHTVTNLKAEKTYILKETVAPEGYELTTDTTFTLKEDGTIDTSKTTTNTKDGILLVEDQKTSVKISKVDITDDQELEGATLQILDQDGNVVEEWISTGEAYEVIGLKTGETYTLREIVAPEGYEIAADTTFILKKDGTIDSDNTTTTILDGSILLVEDTKTYVKISKVDVTDQKELEGATIQIIDEDGNVVEEWISTKEAHEVTGLKTGEIYTLRETVAPEGYDITTDTTFTLKEDGTIDTDKTTASIKDGVLLVEDSKTQEQTYSVEVSKVDIGSGEELDGAHIQVLDQNGKVIDEWDSKAGETHKVENLNADETYTLRETVAPEGYSITTDTTFILKEDGTIDNGKTTTNTKDGVLLVEDSKTSVKISKVDITDQKELEGATIQIIDKDGNVVKEWTSTRETYEVTGLKTGETYTLRETVAPEGYDIATDTTFTLKEDGTIDISKTTTTTQDGILLVEDEKLGEKTYSVTVAKVDIASGEELDGAHIQILDKDGNIIDEWDSKAGEAHKVEDLNADETYTLKETVAPEGYTITTDTTFTIDKDGKVTGTASINEAGVILVEDSMTSVKISKVDVTDQRELEGATIQIIDKDGKVVEEWISTKEAHEITGLKTGETYILRETVAPEGYDIAADTTFTLKEDGTIDASKTSTKTKDGILLVEDVKTSTTEATTETTEATTSTTEVNEATESSTESTVEATTEATTEATGQTPTTTSLEVTKKIAKVDGIDFVDLTVEDATFYVGLFKDANGTEPYGDGTEYVKEIQIRQSSVSEPVVYSDLPDGTYYVLETDKDGNPIPMKEIMTQETGEKYMCTLEAGSSNEVTLNLEDGQDTGSTILINAYYELPSGYAYSAEIEIIKAVLKDGNTVNVNDTFYAGIFTKDSSGNYTLYKEVELEQNSSVSVEVPLGGENGTEEITYYVFETDGFGNRVSEDSGFAYIVSGEGTVTLSQDKMEDTITITNEVVDQDIEIEILKVDESGKTLSGAQFTLNTDDGEEIADWKSGKKAKKFVLEPGTYILEETKAPTGYVKGNEVKITIAEDGTITIDGSDAKLSGTTLKYVNKKEAATTTQSASTSANKTSSNAKTGDNNNIALYLLTMLCAAIVLTLLVTRRSKKK